jgi:hypothetical protein
MGHDISPHQAAVAFDIGGENRGELPFDRLGFQTSAPPRPDYSPTGCDIRASVDHSESRWCRMSVADGVSTVSDRSPRTDPAKELSRPAAGFVERKGSLYPLSLSVRPGRRPTGER